MDRLEIAKQIARENYGEGVKVIMLDGTPTKIERTLLLDNTGRISLKTKKVNRWEFKCFLKSNTAEVEKEFYLNIIWDGSEKPSYEFVDKE
jgi:hypothetical protein